MKNKLYILLTLLCFIPTLVFAQNDKLSEEYQLNLYKAEVIDVSNEKVKDATIQTIKIKILNRDYKGYKTTIKNTLTNNGHDIKLNKRNKISVHMEMNEEKPSFYFHSYDKSFSLLVLCIIFTICILIFGGLKGLKALIALILTILLIFLLLIPLLLKGYSPILLSIVTCVLATIITFIITNGFTKKTLTAILGVSFGLLVGGIIAYLFGIFTKVSGVSTENAQMLQYLPSGIIFDFKGLLFAGIIIGSLGACMDVAMELTSSLIEIKTHHPKISDKKLIKSGFNIGKDIMGTMVNTLILAYTGGSLSTILIFVGFNKSFSEVINLDSITIEIVRALSGSIGLLFAIPFTIFAFIFLNKRGSHEKNN